MGNLSVQYIFNFLFFFLISLIIQFFSLPTFKKWNIDKPNERSLHKTPTPTSGGIVFVLVGTIGSLWYETYLLLACIPLAIVGLIDDRFNISIKYRFFIQIITALLLINLSPLEINTNILAVDYFLKILLIISLIAIINFVNFMDGVDGLVTGTMTIYLLIFSIVFSQSLIPLVGSLTAFLIFNWSPAKIFMGDVGSTFLGAIFGGILLQMPNWSSSFEYLIVGSPFLADAFICVIRRFFNGENIFYGHNKHLFQRLIDQKGLTPAKISLIYIFGSISSSISLFFGGINFLFINLIFLMLLGIYLDQVIARPFISEN